MCVAFVSVHTCIILVDCCVVKMQVANDLNDMSSCSLPYSFNGGFLDSGFPTLMWTKKMRMPSLKDGGRRETLSCR